MQDWSFGCVIDFHFRNGEPVHVRLIVKDSVMTASHNWANSPCA